MELVNVLDRKRINEGNAFIATFMDIKNLVDEYPTNGKGEYVDMIDGMCLQKISYLNYDNSFDSIIKVLRKIDSLDIDTDQNNLYGEITHALLDYNIKALWEALINFLEWLCIEKEVTF